jgi:hypothetical protein
MKKIIILAVVAIASQAVAIFAGESNNFIQTNFGPRYAF